MEKLKTLLVRAPGPALQLALAAFLLGPMFGKTGWMATYAAQGLLVASLVLGCALRYGGSPRRLRSLALDRTSGCRVLTVLLSSYLICDGMNFTYSPFKSRVAERYPAILCALVLWAGILYYVDRVEKLDNLLVNVALCALSLSLCVLAGLPIEEFDRSWRVIGVGLMTGIGFLASAQYSRFFKGTVMTGLLALMIPSIYFAIRWNQPAALVESMSAAEKQTLWSSSFLQIRDFQTAEMLFGRGAGYDLELSGMQGIRNFLLSDLLGGGLVRFTLSLALWLCIGYHIVLLFLHCKGVAAIYALVLGGIFIDAFFTAQTGFLSNPFFILYTALLIAEQTMLKKGQARFAGLNAK